MAEAALEQRRKSRRKDDDGASKPKRRRKKREAERAATGDTAEADADSDALVIDEGSSESERADEAPTPAPPRRDAFAALLEQCAGAAAAAPPAAPPAKTSASLTWTASGTAGGEDKKRRPWKNTVKTYYQLPLDSNGEPKLPILIGSMVIHSLGRIDPSDAFHAKRYIWPLGFRSTRPYASMLDFTRKTDYVSEIRLDPSGHAPQFVVTPADDVEHPVVSATASGAWTEIVRRISEARKARTGKQMFTTVSGPEMFGFAHPAVAKLIQDMPGARQCTKYLRQVRASHLISPLFLHPFACSTHRAAQEFVLSANRKPPTSKKAEEGGGGGAEEDDEIQLGGGGGGGDGEQSGDEDD